MVINMLVKGIWGTIYMVFLSPALSYVVSIPLGITLVVTDEGGISPMPLFNGVLGLIINLLRPVPLIIFLIMILFITRFIVEKAIGSNATVVPLIIVASPYVGRMVGSSPKEVDAGVIEATRSMGASTQQTIVKVLLPRAKSSLLVGAVISVTTILGYFAMAGSAGGGGLDDIAIHYGYHRYQTDMMMVTVVLLVIIVQLIQEITMRMLRKSDKRIQWGDPGSGAGKRIR